MSAFSKGDTVRCIKTWTTHVIDRGGEYTVEEVRPDNLTDTMEALVCGDWVPFSYFEKVEPEFVVGQQVSGDDYARLPVGSVVEKEKRKTRTKTAPNFWECPGDFHWTDSMMAGAFERTLTYLPDAAEPEDQSVCDREYDGRHYYAVDGTCQRCGRIGLLLPTEPEDKDDLYVEPEPLKEGASGSLAGASEAFEQMANAMHDFAVGFEKAGQIFWREMQRVLVGGAS